MGEENRMTEAEIEAAVRQGNAMSVISDGYIPSEDENEIMRKCLRGEMSWSEGRRLIMNLPIEEKQPSSYSIF